MSKISKKFIKLKQKGNAAFMPFTVAGDPNYKTSIKILRKLSKTADLLEIGFPYSDPLADGPVIQAANARALVAGANTDMVFKLISEVRKFSDLPITALVYANLVYQYGINDFYRQANRSGINGVLIPDLPIDEAAPFVKAAQENRINPIFLVTQTTTPARLVKILKSAKGYLYLVSVLGVTGARRVFAKNTVEFIKRIKTQTGLPVAVGFGISNANQARTFVAAGADGIIVGSAIIEKIIKHGIGAKLTNFLKEFSTLNYGSRKNLRS